MRMRMWGGGEEEKGRKRNRKRKRLEWPQQRMGKCKDEVDRRK
jgi:hypothetical protein